MKLVVLAAIATSGKVAYNVAGEKFFIPEALRKTAEVGKCAIVIEKSFTQKASVDTEGVPTGEFEECEKWTRNDVTFIGNKAEALAAKTESALMEVEEEAFINQAKANITKNYKLADAQASELV